jgi:hypothetical protein
LKSEKEEDEVEEEEEEEEEDEEKECVFNFREVKCVLYLHNKPTDAH